VVPDPKPPKTVFFLERHGAVRPPDLQGPDASSRLKTERGMMRVLLEQPILLDCQVWNMCGELRFQKRAVAEE
jgi:hypothetical protein